MQKSRWHSGCHLEGWLRNWLKLFILNQLVVGNKGKKKATKIEESEKLQTTAMFFEKASVFSSTFFLYSNHASNFSQHVCFVLVLRLLQEGYLRQPHATAQLATNLSSLTTTAHLPTTSGTPLRLRSRAAPPCWSPRVTFLCLCSNYQKCRYHTNLLA